MGTSARRHSHTSIVELIHPSQERDTNQWTTTEIPALPVSSQTAAARSPWAQLAAAFGMASSWAGPKRHEGCACPPPSRLSKRRRRAWAAASPCGAACTPASIAHSPICEERKTSRTPSCRVLPLVQSSLRERDGRDL